MALQAALTVILLAGSVSLGRSFLKLVDTNLGFDTSQVLTMQVSLEASRHAGSSGFYDDVVQRVRAIPGVEAAGTTLYLPLEPYPNIPGAAITLENDQQYRMRENAVGSGYFAAMHQEFVAGRDFNDAERHGSENAVIVNEEVARSLGLGAKIVGQHLKGKQPATVVGVVRTARWEGPIYGPWGEWFVPLERRKPNFAAFAIRIRGDASSYIPSIRGAVQAVDPAVPIFRVEPMKTFLDERLARPRFYTTAMTFLGGFALLLAAIGIYGVASNSVTQRTREMGVRLAVGASATGVRAMLLRQAMLPLLAGLAMGITGAITLSAYLQHWMTSAEPVGLGATAAAAGTLIVCCASAVWRATARVVSIDPMQALRAD
jgi:predicted permease